LLTTVAVVLKSRGRINQDCALYLQCAQLLLDGQRPYVDFVELNPPFIMYVNVIPVLLARALSSPIVLTFSLCVVALAAWSTLSIQRHLARLPRLRPVAPAAAAVWAMFTLLQRSGYDFGQREHLLALLYMPYLVARSLASPCQESGRSRPSPVFLALAAGCGICLKPHYAPVAAMLELYWLRRQRPVLEPATIAVVAVPLIYALHFAVLPAAVRDALVHRWLPLVAARYSVYNEPLGALFDAPTILSALVGVAVVAASLWLQGSSGSLFGALGLFVSGAVAVYFVQHKAWPYHLMPVIASMALLLTLLTERLLAQVLPSLKKGHPRRLVSAARRLSLTLTAAAVPLLVGVAWIVAVSPLPLPLIDHLVWEGPLWPLVNRYSDRNEAVLFVSTSVVPAYPLLLQMERRPGSRYLWFFPIPMLTAGDIGQTPGNLWPANDAWLQAQEDQFLRDLTDDVASRRPPIIFIRIDSGCQGCAPGFTILRYLGERGVMDRIERDYTRVTVTSGFVMYVINDRLGR
jgi:hypothetical protein